MVAAYMFLSSNCILVCEIYFSGRWGHCKLTTSKNKFFDVFIAQISHYRKFTALHKLAIIDELN